MPAEARDEGTEADVLHAGAQHEAPPQAEQTERRGEHERNAQRPREHEVAHYHDNRAERLPTHAPNDADAHALATQ